MKIKPEHYEHMEKAINEVLSRYEEQGKPSTYQWYKAHGLTDERYRWDIAYAAGLTTFFCKTVYLYANDKHIDTALKNITGKKG